MAKTFKTFISHSWSYHDDFLVRLRDLLMSRGYFNVEFLEASADIPINSINAGYIKQVLKNSINSSNILLAIAGVYATHSEWMRWELFTAKINRVPIIGVAPLGHERVSMIVQDYAITIVRWNTGSIVKAIREYSL